MNSRFYSLTRTVWVFCLLGFLVSCQDTMPQRSTISKGNSVDAGPSCVAPEELVYLDEANNKVISVEDYKNLSAEEQEILVPACQEPPVKRPDGAVFWKNDFCACKDGKPVSYGNCSSFCASKNTSGAEVLFANFSITEAITKSGLNSVFGWCRANLETDEVNPECKLQAKDENNAVIELDVNIPSNSNSITANIQDALEFDKTYILTLVEKSSGAKSNSIQFIKFSTDLALPILGPLKVASVNQYSCIVRTAATDDNTGDVYFEEAYRLHFYQHPRFPAKTVPLGLGSFVCHDIWTYGQQDEARFPRLENKEGALKFWDETDPRFYDNNGNGIVDINDGIISKVKALGGTIASNISLFRKRQWYNSDVCLSAMESSQGSNSGGRNASLPTELPILGYNLPSWIDTTTYRAYCPKAEHYNSNNTLFKAMRDFIGVDTEAFYGGAKFLNTTSAVGACLTDIVLLRETDIKDVWFYYKNGVPTVPTDDIIANVPVYFHYPLNKASPYVKTSTQGLYRVQTAAELNSILNGNNTPTTTSNPTGGATIFPPHDRRLGCVPKL